MDHETGRRDDDHPPQGIMKNSAPYSDCKTRPLSILMAVGLGLGICHPFLYFNAYTGDGIIHLVFAKNALNGSLFAFNPGKYTGGETSPGFMFILAGLMAACGEATVPAIIKTISILMLYAIGFLTYRLAKLIDIRFPFPAMLALAVLLFPSTAVFGQCGCENSWFAAGLLCLTHELLRRDWLTLPGSFSKSGEFVTGVLFGCLFLFRPEAAPYAFILYTYRIVCSRHDRLLFKTALNRGVVAIAGFAAVSGAFFVWYWIHTGGMIPFTAGAARSIFERINSCIDLGFISINPKFLKLIIAYIALVIPAAFSLVLIKMKKLDAKTSKISGLFISVFSVFFVLYSTVLPAGHLTRYSIFLWPFLVLGGGAALSWSWVHFASLPRMFIFKLGRRWFFAGLAILFAVAVASETCLRNHHRIRGFRLVLSIPFTREQRSQDFWEMLGSPSKKTVNIAAQEVQVRYWLDDRFTVFSLDGIVDNKLVDYISDDHYDHISYLRYRDIDFFPANVPHLPGGINYNRDKSSWALSDLMDLPAGEKTTKSGLTFLKLPSGWVKVIKDVRCQDKVGGIGGEF